MSLRDPHIGQRVRLVKANGSLKVGTLGTVCDCTYRTKRWRRWITQYPVRWDDGQCSTAAEDLVELYFDQQRFDQHLTRNIAAIGNKISGFSSKPAQRSARDHQVFLCGVIYGAMARWKCGDDLPSGEKWKLQENIFDHFSSVTAPN
jgi:hypothetical protein